MTDSNPQIDLAYNFIQYTGMNLFLTGKAGSGKTTFLRRLQAQSPKRMIVLAPTGVAAINAGGVTIHSFFQLPFTPYIPDAVVRQAEKGKGMPNKFSKEKINIMRSLDLLVIDEISMVRSDLLDAIDAVLRKYRDRYKPFGGVQLLMIGDLQQLAPVVKDDEWSMMRTYYKSPFFFHSNALNETPYITIELKKIYRQSDPVFVDILNKIRENRLDDQTLRQLNKRYIPDFDPEETEGYITLTTHNAQANAINQRKLDAITEKEFLFKAVIEGDFPPYSYPTEERLILKKGAQVMFCKNDPTPEKRYYNGKIGIITGIGSGGIIVRCDNQLITVEQQAWTNAKYALDPTTKEIVETIEGTFTQYPLKTAWAITIHKSQGLTFDRAIINAGSAFTHGQVYVALSRCRTLEGLVLSTPIRSSVVMSDQTVDSFNKYMEEHTPDNEVLANAKMQYFQILVGEMFDYKTISNRLQFVSRLFEEHLSRLYPELIRKFKEKLLELEFHMVEVGARFRNQLAFLMQEWKDYENNEVIQDRIRKGVAYFLQHQETILIQLLTEIHPEVDNKEVAKVIEREMDQLREAVIIKKASMEACADGFTVKKYLDAKAKAAISKEKENTRKSATTGKVQKVEVSNDIQNPELYRRIREWRKNEAEEKNLPVYTILQQKALIGIANRLPSDKKELLAIPGIGKKIVEYYGEKLIEMVDEYRADQGESLRLL
ncbi:MAG: HRDC domain-containing protein [Bacteroidales bacterium]